MKFSKAKLVFVSILFSSLLVLALAACGSNSAGSSDSAAVNDADKTIKVGASPTPHAEILNAVKAELEKEGYTLDIVEFTDYIQPNVALSNKELDANYFQHKPYLDNYNAENKTDLEVVLPVHFETMAIYGGKSSDLGKIEEGATIVVPNDTTNEARALLLLQSENIIELKENVGLEATPNDIVNNPKNIKLLEVEAAAVPASLSSSDFAVINGNFALGAGLNPQEALANESVESLAGQTYANYLVARPDNKDSEKIQALVKALKSDAVVEFINSSYSGSVLPAA
ncbi:MAG: MetQ/NlpA family ABC transporter substrate-binding protein [Coriobacteriia bacterium]|nr:MetQ/NlpA family ABC transporter substrate-binding protein [Coriobacteriia bacterium]